MQQSNKSILNGEGLRSLEEQELLQVSGGEDKSILGKIVQTVYETWQFCEKKILN